MFCLFCGRYLFDALDDVSFGCAAAATLSLSLAAATASIALASIRSFRLPRQARGGDALDDALAPYRRDLGFASGLVGGKPDFGNYKFLRMLVAEVVLLSQLEPTKGDKIAYHHAWGEDSATTGESREWMTLRVLC